MDAIEEVGETAATGWTRERVDLVKRAICPKGISDDEFSLFIEQCKRSGLDPLLKEAFCVPRRFNAGNRDRPQWTTKHEFQPSEAGMLARATRFPDFRGIQASAVFAEDEIIVDQGKGEVTHRFNPAKRKGPIVGAWAKVARDNMLPVVVWLDFDGYAQQSPLWSKIPATMIEKCARVAALRKAYPEAFGGLYVKEEPPNEDPEEREVPARQLPSTSRSSQVFAELSAQAKPKASLIVDVQEGESEEEAAAYALIAEAGTSEAYAELPEKLKTLQLKGETRKRVFRAYEAAGLRNANAPTVESDE